jgi:MoxR-like ATPase
MRKVQINTVLIGKEELFKVLALGYACPVSLPVLLQGEPGSAKSHAITDFMQSIYKNQPNLIFSLQLSDFTKGSDITGRVDIGSLVKNNEFRYSRPICKALGIYIDEVGRGSSGVRNTMLSIMNSFS